MLDQDAIGAISLKPEFNPTTPPHFLRESTEPYWRVSGALRSLEKDARAYCSAVALIRYASWQQGVVFEEWDRQGLPGAGPPMIWSDWANMAGREAAYAARNLQESLISLQWSLRQFPARDEINVAELRDVRRALKALFPDARAVRDAIAHPEFYYRDDVDTTDGPRGGQWGPGIFGDEFIASLRGRQQRCPLNEAAAREVCVIVDRVLAAFKPVFRKRDWFAYRL